MGYKRVLICKNCNKIYSFGSAPNVCRRCGATIYNMFWPGGFCQSTSDVAKRTLFGWKFVDEEGKK